MIPSVVYWDVALWAVVGYIAVVTLARLMAYHRRRLMAQARAGRELECRQRIRRARQRRRDLNKVKSPADRGNAA